jgi:hypothetical protein
MAQRTAAGSSRGQEPRRLSATERQSAFVALAQYSAEARQSEVPGGEVLPRRSSSSQVPPPLAMMSNDGGRRGIRPDERTLNRPTDRPGTTPPRGQVRAVPLRAINCLAAAYTRHSERYCARSSGYCTTQPACRDGSATSPGPLSAAVRPWSAQFLARLWQQRRSNMCGPLLSTKPLEKVQQADARKSGMPSLKRLCGVLQKACKGDSGACCNRACAQRCAPELIGVHAIWIMIAQCLRAHLPGRVPARSHARLPSPPTPPPRYPFATGEQHRRVGACGVSSSHHQSMHRPAGSG